MRSGSRFNTQRNRLEACILLIGDIVGKPGRRIIERRRCPT